MSSGKKIYFASDFHLGMPSYEKSLERERKLVAWLEEVRKDAQEIYLLGDLFDFWFEYKTAVPKGFTRLLGKLGEITDSGIPIHLITGNHDMWVFDYIPKETGVILHRKPIEKNFAGKKFFLGHGDGLGPGDHGYKFIKKIFANRFCQWLFARFHPNFGIGIANFWSRKSRGASHNEEKFLGEEKEWLVIFCKKKLQSEHFDYFIFGHRHLPLNIELNNTSRYINLGDWISYFTYAEFDGQELLFKEYKN